MNILIDIVACHFDAIVDVEVRPIGPNRSPLSFGVENSSWLQNGTQSRTQD